MVAQAVVEKRMLLNQRQLNPSSWFPNNRKFKLTEVKVQLAKRNHHKNQISKTRSRSTRSSSKLNYKIIVEMLQLVEVEFPCRKLNINILVPKFHPVRIKMILLFSREVFKLLDQ